MMTRLQERQATDEEKFRNILEERKSIIKELKDLKKLQEDMLKETVEGILARMKKQTEAIHKEINTLRDDMKRLNERISEIEKGYEIGIREILKEVGS
jgi:archaellum component FlaC